MAVLSDLAIPITLSTRAILRIGQSAHNAETEIRFSIPEADQVVLQIYNTLGQHVRTLTNDIFQPGFYNIRWNGKDDNGNNVASGAYFYQLRTRNYLETRQMVLNK